MSTIKNPILYNGYPLNYLGGVFCLPETEAGAGYYTEYQTVYDSFIVKPSSTYAGYQNTMVKSFVDASIWTGRMDLFYVFANNDVSNAVVNWIKTGTNDASTVGSIAFAAWNGFTGNRDNARFIATPYNPTADSINALAASTTIGTYMRLDPAQDGDQAYIGCADANELVIYGDLAGSFFSRINSGSGMIVANTDGAGMFISTRRTNAITEGYRNGLSIISDTDYGETFPNLDLYILRMNGSAGSGSNNQCAVAFIMNGVTDADASTISYIINTYMTSLGTNVY